jgi:hypothetical protein
MINERKVVGLLYVLMRDHMPVGDVAHMLRQITPSNVDNCLLKVAEDLFDRFFVKAEDEPDEQL